MMATMIRDMAFILAALILYDLILKKGIIMIHEAIALFLIVILYIMVIFQMSKMQHFEISLHSAQGSKDDSSSSHQLQEVGN